MGSRGGGAADDRADRAQSAGAVGSLSPGGGGRHQAAPHQRRGVGHVHISRIDGAQPEPCGDGAGAQLGGDGGSSARTALDLSGEEVVEVFAARFRQEDGVRDQKQRLGMEECRAWTKEPVLQRFPAPMTAMTLVRLMQFRLDATRGRETTGGNRRGIVANNIRRSLRGSGQVSICGVCSGDTVRGFSNSC
jgi:hypothetical protein